MKLIEMRCPNCGAPLSVNADRDEAFCLHCNTTFLIEDAPEAKPRKRADVIDSGLAKQPNSEKSAVKIAVEFERAKSETPETKRFFFSLITSKGSKANAPSTNKKQKPKDARKVVGTKKTFVRNKSEKIVERQHIAIAAAIVIVLLVAIIAAAWACSVRDSRNGASQEANGSAVYTESSNAPGAIANSSSAIPPATSTATETSSASAAVAQTLSEGFPTAATSAKASKDGFPCDLDSTASFGGVTIPIDRKWKDYSPVWDWRHYTFSYTAGPSVKREDVKVSISTFTGGDTRDAAAFIEDYADSQPISIYSAECKTKDVSVRDGVTYTRIEIVDSHYESSLRINPSTKIREMHAGDVVRCICLVGYAGNGTGFVAAVSLCGFADTEECIYSANKILDGVTFNPNECNIDSIDSWLYEVQH